MKYSIRTISKHHIAYGLLPHKRNQDVVRIIHRRGDLRFAASVVDGWNNLDYLPDNVPGRKVAEFVAREFPRMFLAAVQGTQFQRTAQNVADEIDKKVLALYPAHTSCVGAFLFSFSNTTIIVSVGNRAIGVLVWNGRTWYKPKEIGDYTIEYPKYPTDALRFFGHGELKGDPLYSCMPDVVVLPTGTPVFLATDGVEDIFTQEETVEFLKANRNASPRELVERFMREVIRRGTQRDDISILVRA